MIHLTERPGHDTVHCYRDAALEQVWRLVSLVDRNPHSPTRGSFSRTHWAWKFSDMPYPRMQEGVYALARLHDLDVPGNPLFRSAAAESWVAWALEYWTSLQHGNGAYDEAYPFEQCLAATAFTGFYVGGAYVRWRDRLDRGVKDKVENALIKANTWLCDHDETHGILSNHLAVAAVSLEQAAHAFDRPRFSERARVYRDRILEHQSPEGWMSEYGGADPGYGGHAFFYLAAYARLAKCERTREALGRFAEFLTHFVHPDGTIGGEYASRNTEFYYPAGFEMMAAESPACAAIAGGLRTAIADRRVCGVWSVDDFNFMPMLNNVLFALDAAEPSLGAVALPFERAPFRRYFPVSGLWVVNEPAYYAIAGISKGGTVSVFDKAARKLAARHSGLIAELDGARYTSQDHVLSPPADYDEAAGRLTTTVGWKSLKTTVFDSTLFLAFRLFTLTVGRVPAISQWLKTTLVRVLITRKSRPSVQHRRTLSVMPDGIHIADEIETPWDTGQLQAFEHFTAIHMGSSLYADVRAGHGDAAGVRWPLGRSIRLQGKLTPAGTSWERVGR